MPSSELVSSNKDTNTRLDRGSYHVPGTEKLDRQDLDLESHNENDTNSQTYPTSRPDRKLDTRKKAGLFIPTTNTMSYPPQPVGGTHPYGHSDPERGGNSGNVSFAGLPSSGSSGKVRQQGEYLELGGYGGASQSQGDLRLPDGQVPATKVCILV